MVDAAASTKGDLHLANIVKEFGDFRAVDDLSLVIPEGSFFALLGPSGCGKTTTLRMIAGLEEPTSGKIAIGGTDITYAKPYARPVNTVFQNYALFPHLTIFENVAFGLRRRGVKDIKEAVSKVLALVELEHLAQRKPSQLSGGQQQRIAVARAIVNRPALLLLDEPLGALDLKLRRQMQIELKWIQTEVGLTFVHVTHDQEEAMTMADTIAVMNEGRIEQMGSPVELYESPRTVFVANFLGQSNLVKGKIEGSSGNDIQVSVHGNRISVPPTRNFAKDNAEKSVLIGIRPEKISIERSEDNSLGGGIITDISFVGVSTQFQIQMPWGQELSVFEQNDGGASHLQKGDTVSLSWKPAFTFALDGTADVDAGTTVNPEEI
ncbi:MAG TPA: ABC transporter ATP-binding protein [Candidatus Paceibacterota bacterium]|nr:ABC transporter ATP-binding protein [Candidatus Paceibacterota bacterium]